MTPKVLQATAQNTDMLTSIHFQNRIDKMNFENERINSQKVYQK